MTEYRVVVCHNNAKPFSLYTFNDFHDCYAELIRLISIKQNSAKPEYYVYNDFYENIYPPIINQLTTFKIECRKVSNWEMYTENKDINTKKGKIINLF